MISSIETIQIAINFLSVNAKLGHINSLTLLFLTRKETETFVVYQQTLRNRICWTVLFNDLHPFPTLCRILSLTAGFDIKDD